MAEYTLTYSPLLDGWTSFHSYHPEWMEHMNSFMYTFKNGEMWKHNSNPIRNSWYGTTYPSSVTVLFNDSPNEPKMFKTLSYDSDHKWNATVITDLSSGSMDKSYFEEKEGFFFTYIRRNSGTVDYKAMSTQGIGNASAVTLVGVATYRLDFTFDIGSIMSVGDLLYVVPSGTPLVSGQITALTSNSITIVMVVGGTIPVAGNFIMFVKDAVAESYGARGYYMETTLTNTDTEAVELFAISSQIFKSYP